MTIKTFKHCTFVALIFLSYSLNAFSQNTENLESTVKKLNTRVENLESRLNQIERDHLEIISEFEKRFETPSNPDNGNIQNFTCRIRDTFQKGSYLGKSSSKLLATAKARQSCQKAGVTPSYCAKAVEECEQEIKGHSYGCVVTDSYSFANFDGIANTQVEAAHIAQINCEAEARSKTYCSNNPLCERIQVR
jgi:hypothetical protein